MSRDITIIQGGRVDIQVYQNDDEATDVDFIMKNDETEAVITVNAAYVDGVAQVELIAMYTSTVGTYSYQINENTPTGIIKYGLDNCSECNFGKVYICESLDVVVS